MQSVGHDPHELIEAGRANLAAGRLVHALGFLEQASARAPQSAEAHFLLGAVHHRLHQLPEALRAFDAAIALDPTDLQAAQAALAVLCELGRADEALRRSVNLRSAHPHDPQLNFNVALVHEALGDWDAALQHYDRALEAVPKAVPPRLNRGLALTKLGRLDEAYENNRMLARAEPTLPDAHFNVAEVCLAMERYDEAIAHCDRALALEPNHGNAFLDRGLALAALGRIAEGQGALTRAHMLGARAPRLNAGWAAASDATGELDAREVYLVRAYDRLEACDWSGLERLRARFVALVNADTEPPLGSPPLAFRAMMLALPPPVQLRLARQTARRWASRPAVERVRPAGEPARRIRIGYVSSDYRDHPMGHLTAGFFARHDRARVEVFGYALAPDDGSDYRRRIADGCDRFADVSGLATEEIARAIAADRIDVLVNLNGYTTGHRTAVFAARPAPVQVSWIGFVGTMGAEFIDYLIADPVVAPEADESWYTEAIVRLPRCYLVNDPDESLLPAPPRRVAGLPDTGIVFCDFNQHVKIVPEVFAAWMRILRRVEGSVLWLLDGPGRANLARHALAAGIAPARLVFAPRLPRAEHLARLRLADLFLDTSPCNAHTTAWDALLAAVPVLTCPGKTFASRVAASLANAAGLAELVVRDLAEYEQRAVSLVCDRARLTACKRSLAEERAGLALFDVAARVCELEAAYVEMAARHRAGAPPASFSVPEGAGKLR